MIEEFQGPYRFLSNFCGTPFRLSVEHVFQALKTTDWRDQVSILCASTPGAAKGLGREVALRPDWNNIRVDVMRELLRYKFADPDFAHRLLATGDALLIEGNRWNDRFWGVCPVGSGEGENQLGFLLMEIRDELRVLALSGRVGA